MKFLITDVIYIIIILLLKKLQTSKASRTPLDVSVKFLNCDVLDLSFSIRISFWSSLDLSIKPLAEAMTTGLLSVIFALFCSTYNNIHKIMITQDQSLNI